MKHLVTTHPAACSRSTVKFVKYLVQILNLTSGFPNDFLRRWVADSPLIQLRVAILKHVTEAVDNPKASAQWIILNNIYP